MSCTRCGAPLSDDATACASCGTPRAAATPGARELLGNLSRAAARADERLRDPDLAQRIPGGSLAVVGYAVLLLACLLDVLPFAHTGKFVTYGWRYSKLGHFWDVVLPVLALAALAGRLYAAKDPRASRLAHPALHSAVAVLALAQAYLLFDISVIPLLVLLAALILVYDAVHSGLAGMAVRAVGERLDAIGNGTVIGIGLCLVALALTFLPGSHNWLGGFLVLGNEVLDRSWAAVLVLGGVAAIALDRTPEKPFTPFVVGGYVLLQVAFVIVEFTLALVPLVWATGAVFAARDQWRKAKARTGGEPTLSQLTAGPRRLVLAGVPICLLAMSFTWSEKSTPGYLAGAYDTSYSGYYGGYVSTWNYAHTYNPGFTFTGTGFQQGPKWLSFSPLVVAGLLVLLVLAVWRSTKPVPKWAYLLPGGIVAAIALWTLVHITGGFGPWAFLPGLALLGLAAFTVGLPTVREMTAARAAAAGTAPGTAPGEPPPPGAYPPPAMPS